MMASAEVVATENGPPKVRHREGKGLAVGITLQGGLGTFLIHSTIKRERDKEEEVASSSPAVGSDGSDDRTLSQVDEGRGGG